MQLSYVIVVFEIIVFLFAISVHESAHAWMANRCGDPTARMLGRITLNPVRHIDLFGTILVPAICLFSGLPMFGWAKPTPVDPRNFRHEVRDDILTSVAGPVSNFLVALGAVGILRLISLVSPEAKLIVLASVGGQIVDNGSALVPIVLLLHWTVILNVILAVFNLIPVPPLDGSHVVRHVLAPSARRIYDAVGWIGLMILFVVPASSRFLDALITPVLAIFNSLVASS